MLRKNYHGAGIKSVSNKYRQTKLYGTGSDPIGVVIEFIQKDPVSNIDVHKNSSKRVDDLDSRKNEIAIGCKKNYLKHKSTNPAVPYEMITDHISFQLPATSSKQLPQIEKYTKSTTSKQGWVANNSYISTNNFQSTSYNIINFLENPISISQKSNSIYNGKSKGISQFYDLSKQPDPKMNKEYTKAITEDPKVFNRKTGIFSHMYDAAARHGYMTMPFGKSEEVSRKPVFKS
jgi:hypothetical protein